MKFKRTINTLPHNWLLHHELVESLEKNIRFISGTVIDIGCGLKPYKNIISSRCKNYFGIEHPKSMHSIQEVDIISTATRLPIKDNAVDTVVSFQVMEHIAEPEIFLKEINRILKSDGFCLLTTPFMWGEHEAPYDYYRYTRYGLEYLAKKTGFNVISINADTGYWTTAIIRLNYFLMQYAGNILKYFIIPFVWGNQYCAYVLDRFFDKDSTDTANFTTVLQKP